MFNKTTKKPFQGSHQRSVKHNRLVPLTIFFNVAYFESLWKVKIYLNCRDLPEPVKAIFYFDVDFWSIKHPFPRVNFIL